MSTGPDRFAYGSFEPVSTTAVYLMIKTKNGWFPLSVDEQGYTAPPYFPTESVDSKKAIAFDLVIQQSAVADNIFLRTADGYFLSMSPDNTLFLYNQVTQDLSFIYQPIYIPDVSTWLIQPPISTDPYSLANSIPIVAGVNYNIYMGSSTQWTLPFIKTKTNAQIESSVNGTPASNTDSQENNPIYIIPQTPILIGNNCSQQVDDSLSLLLTNTYLTLYTNKNSCKTGSVGVPTYGNCGGKDFGICSSNSIVCEPYGQSITNCRKSVV